MILMSIDRDENGRFADGNAGGPGRPRRTIEREYLATLGDVVSLGEWREIVLRAVADAKAGDARARDWLSKYLVGAEPPTLLQLAGKEGRGLTVEADVTAEGDRQERDAIWQSPTMPGLFSTFRSRGSDLLDDELEAHAEFDDD